MGFLSLSASFSLLSFVTVLLGGIGEATTVVAFFEVSGTHRKTATENYNPQPGMWTPGE
jgi:hypothetical protein